MNLVENLNMFRIQAVSAENSNSKIERKHKRGRGEEFFTKKELCKLNQKKEVLCEQ